MDFGLRNKVKEIGKERGAGAFWNYGWKEKETQTEKKAKLK